MKEIKLLLASAEVKRHATSTVRFNFALMTAHQNYTMFLARVLAKALNLLFFGFSSGLPKNFSDFSIFLGFDLLNYCFDHF